MKNFTGSILPFAAILIVSTISCNQQKEDKTEEQPAEAVTAKTDEEFKVPADWDPCNDTIFVYDEFTINILQPDRLPYIDHRREPQPRIGYDSDSIPILWGGGTQVYHPIYIAQFALELIDIYHMTKDEHNLNYSIKLADKLLGIAINLDSTLYFPYVYDHVMHGIQSEKLIAPWYSGMAQGQILSLFCRLYELTGNEFYFDKSHMIYKSFTKFKGQGANPWVSCIDKNGNLWLEEYPMTLPCFTLNGTVFAIYGVYDYYRLTKDPKVEKLLKASITTIRKNAGKYRVPGDKSLYCLKHHVPVPSFSYQRIHAGQMKKLYEITGDTFFQTLGEQLLADTREQEEAEKAEKAEKAKQAEEAKQAK